LAGDTARATTSDEVKALRQEARALKEVIAEQALELPLHKKHDRVFVFHSSQPGKSWQKNLTQDDPVFREQSISQGDGPIKRSRFSDEQIIGIIKGQEPGAVTADVCRRHGIIEATFYKWKAKFGDLEVTQANRLFTLEEENAKLKKLLAEATLDIAVLKDISSKKW
jgi:putative transposase